MANGSINTTVKPIILNRACHILYMSIRPQNVFEDGAFLSQNGFPILFPISVVMSDRSKTILLKIIQSGINDKFLSCRTYWEHEHRHHTQLRAEKDD